MDQPTPPETHDLSVTRLYDAPRSKVYRCWTEPALLRQWYVPRPWTISRAEIDARPGGSTLVVMCDPDGKEYPNAGVCLEVVPDTRLVMTDAYRSAWVPSAKPFLTVLVELSDENGQTRMHWSARHWNAEDRAAHEKMGFHQGWGACADQLGELLARM